MKKIVIIATVIFVSILVITTFASDFKTVSLNGDQGIVFQSEKITDLKGNISACDLFIPSKSRIGMLMIESSSGLIYKGNLKSLDEITSACPGMCGKVSSYNNFKVGDCFHIKNNISEGCTFVRISNISGEKITLQYRLK